ncbi:MAG: xanthine dehydrogenase family protein molybdopterin-binding subunit [Candidatus Thermoplasmatota archaeon]|nr:xanthine dehydrogenase family protein molybdopterin-binding subunit [Candidatus Thermoplasmatota archaeon]
MSNQGISEDQYVGNSVPRLEDRRFVTGQGQYVADLSLPEMVHAAFVRSPYAHARILEVDLEAVRGMPGILGAWSGGDLEGALGTMPTEVGLEEASLKKPPYPAVAVDRVRYAGEAVAVIAAVDPYALEDALDLADVGYEPLPVVTNQEEALREGAPQLHDEVPQNLAFRWHLEGGDVDRAFREADLVVEQRIVNQRLQPTAVEPRAAVARWDEQTGQLTLWVTSQNPKTHREVLARVLGMSEANLRVIAPDVGGGFGSKIAVYPGEAVVCHLARRLGRPVKWVETRVENFLVTTHGRDHIQDVRIAARSDGTILGIDLRSLANLGAYLSTAGPGIPTSPFGKMLSGAYPMQGVRVEVQGVFTNSTPTDAYRGAGRPEAAFAVERMVDILARRLEMDPAEIRRTNFIPPDAFPYEVVTGHTYDSGDYQGALQKALEVVDYPQIRKDQARARAQGRLFGIGISTYVEVCGFGSPGGCRLVVHPAGKVVVYTGAHPHGQGQETSLAQIVADVLTIPLEAVEVRHGDTATTPWGIGTFGSRGLPVEGGASLMAGRKLADAARTRAAELLEARPEDVVLADGKAFVPEAPEKAVTLWDLARSLQETDADGKATPWEVQAFYDTEDYLFPFGTHVCVVEVDPETGEVQIIRYVAVDDCGTVINPQLVAGQVHGGVLQGIGQALWEEARYDEVGNLLTAGLPDYAVPTAVESPAIESVRHVTPSPHNPLGAKGVGEAGTVGAAPAVVNAVIDALAPLGVVHLDMPLTPDRVWAAIHQEERD